MATKKQKVVAMVVVSREAMAAVVADVVDAKLQLTELEAQMEQDILLVQRRYQDRLADLGQKVAACEAGVYVWATQHKAEFGEPGGDKPRSIDLPTAQVGFRLNPPAVTKLRTKDNWRDIAFRLQATQVTKAPEPGAEAAVIFCGAAYVREADPEVNKDGLIADRDKIPAEVLADVGIVISQEDTFFIKPKAEIIAARATKREAA